MKSVASLRYGVIFKKAFSQPDIFTAFVKDILNIDIEIDHVETEKSFDKPIGNVDSRYDLFAEDKKNRIIVEIQHRRYGDHYERFLNYHCAALLEQAMKSSDYKPALAVYTIVVLTIADEYHNFMNYIDFDLRNYKHEKLNRHPHKVIFLCPKHLNEDTPEAWREWLLAIEDSMDEQIDEKKYHNKYVNKILSLIERSELTPTDYARMKDEYAEEQLKQEKLIENFNKGKAEGIEEGKAEGIAQGEYQAKLVMARHLKNLGLPIAQIAAVTELTEVEVSNAPV